MTITKVLMVVLFVVGSLIPVQSTRADVAPEPEVELGGLQPPQFKETEVAMLYERVELELGMFYDETALTPIQNGVTVNAYFMMQNQGTLDESMHAVFPSQSAPVCHGNYSGDSFTVYDILQESFQVIVNGIDIPTFTLEAPYGDCPNYPWLAFDVTFPVGKEVLIKVSYEMQTWTVDTAQNIDYILETGAGWKGNIGRGYVVFKFPYSATTENVLSATTKGYQFLYNEIFWSFQDLEPTPQDNIHISIVSPNTWLEIKRLRDQLAKIPESPEAWLRLIDIYRSIGFDQKGDFIRNEHYVGLIESAYQQAIAQNSKNAELLAQYARYRLYALSPRLFLTIENDNATQILSLLNKALALEPNNGTAQQTLSDLMSVAPFITFTPPATIHPTATSLFTVTPSITPSATITPISSETPMVVTVVHTKIVNPPTSTKLPEPTVTVALTEIEIQNTEQSESNSSAMVLGALVIFAMGAGSGWFLSKRQKK